ncbi:MAG: hypothetical protein J6R82_04780 [Clostridia bacterium]|nr:hypothetical protein [Clostridia bacterium]
MQLDPSKLRSLAQIDDNRFSAMLFTAARAVGLSPEQAKTAAANAPAFKKMLRSASDEELRLLLAKLQSSPADLLGQIGGGS